MWHSAREGSQLLAQTIWIGKRAVLSKNLAGFVYGRIQFADRDASGASVRCGRDAGMVRDPAGQTVFGTVVSERRHAARPARGNSQLSSLDFSFSRRSNNLVGKSTIINSVPYTVLGVLPKKDRQN
jgi:hypothetical protein